MHNRPSFPMFKLLIWSLSVLLIVFFLFLPTIEFFSEDSTLQSTASSNELEDQFLYDLILLYVTSLFATVSFFALGAAVGSYLNVIVYRVPRNLPLTFSRSSCPVCGSPIKLSDNIPIISWLRLKGRCRDCQAPINIRYPLVEFSVAAIFLILYFRELISGGANIPFRDPNLYNGVLWILFYTKWDLVRLYLLHCFMLTSILGWGLINADGFRIPISSLLTCLCIVFIAILIWPDLIPLKSNLHAAQAPHRSVVLISSFCGAVSGALIAPVLVWIIRKTGLSDFTYSNCINYAFILCGMIYGWQAMLTISLMTFILILLQQISTRHFEIQIMRSPGYAVFLSVFAFHYFWRSLTWF
ncbi:prepilin peptidase [Gimesia aquarii]|nr:prepilin peptidase [Gimesia aquarii]